MLLDIVVMCVVFFFFLFGYLVHSRAAQQNVFVRFVGFLNMFLVSNGVFFFVIAGCFFICLRTNLCIFGMLESSVRALNANQKIITVLNGWIGGKDKQVVYDSWLLHSSILSAINRNDAQNILHYTYLTYRNLCMCFIQFVHVIMITQNNWNLRCIEAKKRKETLPK